MTGPRITLLRPALHIITHYHIVCDHMHGHGEAHNQLNPTAIEAVLLSLSMLHAHRR